VRGRQHNHRQCVNVTLAGLLQQLAGDASQHLQYGQLIKITNGSTADYVIIAVR